MSPSRSDTGIDVTADPLRPGDHADSESATEITQPALGITGWLRWAWRQLTSMRTALVLLLFLAIAAVPGSLFPQRVQDPEAVTSYIEANPTIGPVLDTLQLFDVYSSPWFAAIYLLLFTSLVGCILPRTRVYLRGWRQRPPAVPRRMTRMPGNRVLAVPGATAAPVAE